MKYTVVGFSQEKLVEMSLDLVDANVLRWFVDFQGTGRMKEIEKADSYRFFQVSYAAVIRDLPILGIKDTDGIARRFKRLVSAGVLEHYHHKVGGSFSTYRLSHAYDPLVSDTPPPSQKSEGPSENRDPLRLKSRTPSVSKVGAKNSSTSNSSTSTQEENSEHAPDGGDLDMFSTEQGLSEQAPGKLKPEDILTLLNELTGSRFREHKGTGLTKLIASGYTIDDFRAVFTEKTRQWKGSEWEKYLRPDTLFRPAKFESYLAEAGRSKQGAPQGKFRASSFDETQSGYRVETL